MRTHNIGFYEKMMKIIFLAEGAVLSLIFSKFQKDIYFFVKRRSCVTRRLTFIISHWFPFK